MYLYFYYGIYPISNKLIFTYMHDFMPILFIIRNMLFMLVIAQNNLMDFMLVTS